MNAPNFQHAWASFIVDELARAGVRHAVVCPGSRSTPLAWSLGSDERVRTWPVPDERSGAFLALGMARATLEPVVVLCTSGTAGAHFLPAIIEAQLSGIPLVAITADRPPELHGFGASQSIDQAALFGRYALFQELGVPDVEAAVHLRASVSLLVQRARHERTPVHFNAPFREPLAPTPQPLPSLPPLALNGRADGAPFLRIVPPVLAPSREAVETVATALQRSTRPVVVCGPDVIDVELARTVAQWASANSIPLIAESASGIRYAVRGTTQVMHQDVILRRPDLQEAFAPDLVVRLGGRLATRQLQGMVDRAARVVLVSRRAEPMDPHHSADVLVVADPAVLFAQLGTQARSSSWCQAWLRADADVEAHLRAHTSGELSEPAIARTTASCVPPGGNLWVSSSMPIRDLEAVAIPGDSSFNVLANRGAAGIDGMIACALGAAAATGKRTVLLVGDTAFMHDATSLAWGARLGIPLVVVVVNNDGGRIFSFLPVGSHAQHLDRLFTMPTGVDPTAVAAMANARSWQPSHTKELAAAIHEGLEGGLHVINARVDGATTVTQHRELLDGAAARVGTPSW